MGYAQSLEAAGADVIDYEEFGSYQGDWFAFVKYNDKPGFVHGSFGSCSGCDAFQAEFGYDSHCHGSDYKYIEDGEVDSDCEICRDNHAKLAAFGASYLESVMTYDEAIKEASRYIEWDSDAKDMVAWLEGHKAEFQLSSYEGN